MNKSRAKRMTKADLILISLLLFAGIAGFFAVRTLTGKDAVTVRILSDGELYGTYQLSEEQNIPILKNGNVVNTLQISGRNADMIQADCPDQLCVRQRAISRQGETIVCLPNKIVVEIVGGSDAGLDSISR